MPFPPPSLGCCATVSELVLLVALCISSLVAVRAYGALPPSPGRARSDYVERVVGAMQRAGGLFVGRELRLLATVAGLAGLVLLVGSELFGQGQSATRVRLAFAAVGLLVGASCSAVCAVGTFSLGMRAIRAQLGSPAIAGEAGDELPLELRRAGSLLAVLWDTLSLLALLAAASVHCAYGVLVLGQPLREALLDACYYSAPGVALGALCGAAVFQAAGSCFSTATAVASGAARRSVPVLGDRRQQNPGLVAELVGAHLGGAVSRATDAFGTYALGNVAVVAVAALTAGRVAAPEQAVAIVALPLVLRASGLLGCACQLNPTLRSAESSPATASRSIAAALVAFSGLVGASVWLVGTAHCLYFIAAGLLGLVAGVLASAPGPLSRVAPEIALEKMGASAARAIGVGLQSTGVPLLAMGVCLGLSWVVLEPVPLPNSQQLGLGLAVAAMLGSSSLPLGVGLLVALSESAQRLERLERDVAAQPAPSGPGSEERVALLKAGEHAGQTHLILCAGAASLLCVLAMPRLFGEPAAAAGEASYGSLLVAGVLGAACILFFVGASLRLRSAAAGKVGGDLLSHLGLIEDGRPPASGARGYRPSLEIASKASLEAAIPLVVLATLLPSSVALALRAAAGADSPLELGRGLLAFGAVAVLTGASTALAAHGAVGAMASERLDRESSSTLVLGRSIGPSALLGLQAAVAASLALSPFLFPS